MFIGRSSLGSCYTNFHVQFLTALPRLRLGSRTVLPFAKIRNCMDRIKISLVSYHLRSINGLLAKSIC